MIRLSEEAGAAEIFATTRRFGTGAGTLVVMDPGNPGNGSWNDNKARRKTPACAYPIEYSERLRKKIWPVTEEISSC